MALHEFLKTGVFSSERTVVKSSSKQACEQKIILGKNLITVSQNMDFIVQATKISKISE